MSERIDPSTARICEDCALVTTDEKCPLCEVKTQPHPDAKQDSQYCIDCAGGPFKSNTLHLVTWNEDPYIQIEDADLMTVCEKCRAKGGRR